MTPTKWERRDVNPGIVGWYATLACWDANEGVFPGATYWDGAKWADRLPVVGYSSQSFASAEEAKDWAYEHDPDD